MASSVTKGVRVNAQEKNALIDSAKTTMNVAIGLVIAEVFSGLAQAPALLLSAAAMIRSTGDDEDSAQAEARAAECPGILLIPWPFIYVGSNAWIAAVAQLRDALPHFIDLEGVAKRAAGAAKDREMRALQARKRWDGLTDAQRSALAGAKITPEMLSSLGSA